MAAVLAPDQLSFQTQETGTASIPFQGKTEGHECPISQLAGHFETACTTTGSPGLRAPSLRWFVLYIISS